MEKARAARKYLIFGLSLVLLFLLSYPIIYYPLGRDHAISAYIGKVINEGGVPFKDGWSRNPRWCITGIPWHSFSLVNRWKASVFLTFSTLSVP